MTKPDQAVPVSLVVAMARNRVIGRDGGLPWRLPQDLKFFKRTTLGKPVLMGRKTFESIGRPLPKRRNIVITRNNDWPAPQGVERAVSLQAALAMAAEPAPEEIAVIGGGQIYAEALAAPGLVTRIYLTEVQGEVEGDTHFPALGPEWAEVDAFDLPDDPQASHSARVRVLERR